MPQSTAAAALLLFSSATAVSVPTSTGQGGSVERAHLTFHERITIRIHSSARPASSTAALTQPLRWAEKKGPKCITANQLGGAIVGATDSVDIVLKGGARVRAKLNGECAGLGFYGGFYLKPSFDGQVCAGRDSIRTRSGDACTISRFRSLVAKR